MFGSVTVIGAGGRAGSAISARLHEHGLSLDLMRRGSERQFIAQQYLHFRGDSWLETLLTGGQVARPMAAAAPAVAPTRGVK